MPDVQKELDFTKKLLAERNKDMVDDLLIMLNLYSSKCLLMTRRLISSERDLKTAIKIFKNLHKVRQRDRHDIPIIPKYILRQRILLQKALIMKAYSKNQEAALLLTGLIKIDTNFDPLTKEAALKALHELFVNHPKGNFIKMYPETKNIELMLQLYQNVKIKNVVI